MNLTKEPIAKILETILRKEAGYKIWIIQNLCRHHYYIQAFFNIIDKTSECIDSFKNRTLNKEYALIYLDGTSMALRQDTVSREMVHIQRNLRPKILIEKK